MSEDLHTPRIPAVDARRAAEIDAATFKNWAHAKPSPIILAASERDRLASGAGDRHLLTLATVDHIAITAELNRIGFHPRAAAEIAGGFCFLDGGGDDATPTPGREPGRLFQSGRTILVAYAGRKMGRVVNVLDDDLTSLFASNTARVVAGFGALDVGIVLRRVRRELRI